jgi:hypothetical protein
MITRGRLISALLIALGGLCSQGCATMLVCMATSKGRIVNEYPQVSKILHRDDREMIVVYVEMKADAAAESGVDGLADRKFLCIKNQDITRKFREILEETNADAIHIEVNEGPDGPHFFTLVDILCESEVATDIVVKTEMRAHHWEIEIGNDCDVSDAKEFDLKSGRKLFVTMKVSTHKTDWVSRVLLLPVAVAIDIATLPITVPVVIIGLSTARSGSG